MRLKKRTLVLLGAAVVAVGLAVGAYAYFTSTGNGTGNATVGTSSAWTVTPTDVSASNKLYPGGAGYAVDGSVTNPSTGNQQLHQLVATIQAPTGTGSDATKPACTAADFSLSNTGSWVVAGDGQSATLTIDSELTPSGSYPWSGLTLSMVNRSDTVSGDGLGNQDNCKDASAHVKFDAS
jgi:hypothetical protein